MKTSKFIFEKTGIFSNFYTTTWGLIWQINCIIITDGGLARVKRGPAFTPVHHTLATVIRSPCLRKIDCILPQLKSIYFNHGTAKKLVSLERGAAPSSQIPEIEIHWDLPCWCAFCRGVLVYGGCRHLFQNRECKCGTRHVCGLDSIYLLDAWNDYCQLNRKIKLVF